MNSFLFTCLGKKAGEKPNYPYSKEMKVCIGFSSSIFSNLT
jgi:hypothetical protein